MSKKRMIIVTLVILSIVIIALGIVKLYQTYALGNYIDTTSSSNFAVNITNTTSVRVSANGYSNVFYMITNTSPGTVKYGVAYTTDSSITVKVFSTSKDSASGLIEENGKKYVKLRLENSSSTVKNITLSTVLGYENGGDLIPPNGVTLVTKKYYEATISLVEYITNLYTEAEKETVTNNSITYNTAPSVSLMNDRLGGTTEDLNGGNIRYYGESPNNYIYFNCETYPSTNCELWRIIGIFDNKVKLIRNESIGYYSWDNKDESAGTEYGIGSNDWTTSRLMKMLNPNDYYLSEDSNTEGLYYYSSSGQCPSGGHALDCDFSLNGSIIGLQTEETRSLVEEMQWNLGGIDGSNSYFSLEFYPNQSYEYERGTDVYDDGRETTWIGKIGLIYPSDIGYTMDLNSCDKTFWNYQYKRDSCTGWLAKNQWLLLHDNYTSSGVLYYIGSIEAFNTYDVYPSLYLKSELKLESVFGDGSSSNPYRLSVN